MMRVRPYIAYIGVALLLALFAAGVAWNASASDEAAIARCARNPDMKLTCYEDLILNMLRERGLGQALDTVVVLYDRDPDFASSCHANMHEVGKEAYKLFNDGEPLDINQKTYYCGYGFYHGFIEEMFYQGGDIKQARAFCDGLEEGGSVSGGSRIACYHGIGHGVTDGTDPRLWGDAMAFIQPALELCAKVADTELKREQCATGVFNSLAIVYHHPQYNLGVDRSDPFAICKKFTDHAFAAACHDQMNTYLIDTYPSFSEALALLMRTAAPAYRINAVEGLASYAAKAAVLAGGDMSEYITACGTLPDSLSGECVASFERGLFEFGKPREEYIAAANFCAASGAFAKRCFLEYDRTVTHVYESSLKAQACAYAGQVAGGERERTCASFAPGAESESLPR